MRTGRMRAFDALRRRRAAARASRPRVRAGPRDRSPSHIAEPAQIAVRGIGLDPALRVEADVLQHQHHVAVEALRARAPRRSRPPTARAPAVRRRSRAGAADRCRVDGREGHLRLRAGGERYRGKGREGRRARREAHAWSRSAAGPSSAFSMRHATGSPCRRSQLRTGNSPSISASAVARAGAGRSGGFAGREHETPGRERARRPRGARHTDGEARRHETPASIVMCASEPVTGIGPRGR